MVRTKELGRAKPSATPGAALLLYTCPAGKTAIVKEFSYRVIAATTMTVYTLRSSVVYYQLEVITSGTAVTSSVLRFTVMEPGDTLWVLWSTTGQNSSMWASGAELDGVA